MRRWRTSLRSGFTPTAKATVEISPKLTTYLSKYPWVKFEYSEQGTVIRVAGYELKGNPWVKWTPEARPKKATGRRR